MPVLTNPKHERFAQELAKGKSATEAMEAAGYGDPRNSTRLTKNDEIRKRVDELQGNAAEKAELSRAWVLEHLMHNALVAVGAKKIKLTVKHRGDDLPVDVEVNMRDATAANRALELLGRECGMFIERSEVGLPGEFERLDDLQLRQRLLETAMMLGIEFRSDETSH